MFDHKSTMHDDVRAELLLGAARHSRLSPKQRKRGANAVIVIVLTLTCIYLDVRDYDVLSSYTSRKLSMPDVALQAPSTRISFTLWRNNSFQNLFTPFYTCPTSQHMLHPDMQDDLEFHHYRIYKLEDSLYGRLCCRSECSDVSRGCQST